VHLAQVGDQLAQRPAGERLAELDRSGGGRRNDEILVVIDELAGTASRPLRVQAGQADLVEAVDHVPDGVLAACTSWAITGTRFPPAEASSIITRR
jgi:hypothetical protein